MLLPTHFEEGRQSLFILEIVFDGFTGVVRGFTPQRDLWKTNRVFPEEPHSVAGPGDGVFTARSRRRRHPYDEFVSELVDQRSADRDYRIVVDETSLRNPPLMRNDD